MFTTKTDTNKTESIVKEMGLTLDCYCPEYDAVRLTGQIGKLNVIVYIRQPRVDMVTVKPEIMSLHVLVAGSFQTFKLPDNA